MIKNTFFVFASLQVFRSSLAASRVCLLCGLGAQLSGGWGDWQLLPILGRTLPQLSRTALQTHPLVEQKAVRREKTQSVECFKYKCWTPCVLFEQRPADKKWSSQWFVGLTLPIWKMPCVLQTTLSGVFYPRYRPQKIHKAVDIIARDNWEVVYSWRHK